MRTQHHIFFALIFMLLSSFAFGQTNLTLDNSVHTIWASGAYEDFTIPSNPGVYDEIEFVLNGGDGGRRRRATGGCKKKGGAGAKVGVRFKIGNGTGELKPGSTIRFVAGEKGENQVSNGVRGAGGGGGSGILYLAAGASHTYINDYPVLDLNFSDTSWVLLAVAGGGGGAGSDGVCNGTRGTGGRAGTSGSDGRRSGGDGGTNGNGGWGFGRPSGTWGGVFYSGGGGGYRGNGGNFDGNKGGLTGGNGGNRGRANGGFGYGSGGSGDEAGGGGGGYSGGGGAYVNDFELSPGGGGGGGSYANSANTSSAIDAGGSRNDPDDGYISYQFKDLSANTPNAVCQDVVLNLGANGQATLNASAMNNGSTNPISGSLTYCIELSNTSCTSSTTLTCSDLGSSLYTLKVSNTVGSSTCQSNVTVEDNIAPTAICKNLTVSTDAQGQANIIGSAVNNGSNDNCTATGDLTFSLNQTSFTYASASSNTHTVTLSVSDDEDNVSTCTGQIEVEDNLPPVAICQNQTVNLASGLINTVSYSSILSNSYDEGGSGLQPFFGDFNFNCSHLGTQTRTLTVDDQASNSSSCTVTITVNDAIFPTINCPSNISTSNDAGSCGAIVSYTVSSSDNCSVSHAQTDASGFTSGDEFPIGTTSQSYTATDAVGHTASCSFSITVSDNQAPSINCPQNIVQSNDLNTCDAVVNFSVTGADNCSGESISQTAGKASGSVFPLGTTNNKFTVTDAAGHTASCSFSVRINDDQDPTITCPGNFSINAQNGQCNALVGYTYTTSDNCAAPIFQSYGSKNGITPLGVGIHTVPLSVTDASGNSASCSFTVTVVDNQAPTISCPQNITRSNDLDVCGSVVNYNVSYADNCSGESISQTGGLASGSQFNVGTTTNSFTVTDASGNTADCSFTVTVSDNQAPTISCPQNIVQSNDLNTCDAVVNFSVTGADNCSGESISQTAGKASGSVFPLGTTNNRFTVTDAAGHTASCSFSVRINDDQDPTITCPNNFSINAQNGQCNALVGYTYTTSDNCAAPIFQSYGSKNGITPLDVGIHTVPLSVIDASGNSASCSFTVTVVDNQAPTISCPTSIVVPNAPGQCEQTVTYLAPVGQDNCNNPSTQMMSGLGSGSVFPFGTTTETYQVTDAAGHSASCSFTIIVFDDEKPVISLVGANPVILCEGESYVEAGATAIDNCDNNVRPVLVNSSGVNSLQAGNYAVTYDVTDVHGNSAIQVTRSVIVKHRPAQLAPQNCGSCSQIRFDFCEGEAAPDLEVLLQNNIDYETGALFLWYADNSNSQGSPISTPTPNMTNKNTNFYWVSQIENDCEGPARRVRVRVRKTSTVVMDLPAIGCGNSSINLVSWVSDSRGIATGFTFYDSDPALGASALGTVSATNGNVDNGQNMIVSLPSNPITYYATASNNTGCQVTGSDEVIAGAGASLDSIPNLTVNAGDLVQVSFTSPDATHILWFNHSSFNNPYIGLLGSLGMGDLVFTAQNYGSSPQTAMLRAIAYNGNCAGEVRDFTITVLPGTNNRQAGNHLQLTASKVNAHDVELNWQIDYEFALTHLEIEKQMNEGDWEIIDHQNVDQHGVGSHYNVTLQGGYLDRGGMGNLTKYRLKLIHPDGRAIWSQEVEVNFDYFDTKRFTLYPNPSNGRFNLRAAGPLEGEWRYKLSDQLGRTILIGKLTGSETAFDISRLPTGHYYLVMASSEGKRYIERLVKR